MRRRTALSAAGTSSGAAIAAALVTAALPGAAYAQDAQQATGEEVVDDAGSIIVTGFRASLQSAINQKRNAEQI
ncbi:hypothetical protein AB5N48_22610, partial [Xanthomonas citri pv. citri]